jgi:hypothetical protein
LVVEVNDRFVAALPLVCGRLKGLVRVGRLPSNTWAAYGDLLLDPTADVAAVLDQLVSGLKLLGWPLFYWSHVALDSPRWRAMLEALGRAGLHANVSEHYRVGQVEIGSDWQAYEAQRTGRHRRKRHKFARALERAGGARLCYQTSVDPSDIETLLQRGFEVEDRSWKGDEGTSVLKAPGMFEFFCHEARQLAEWNQLRLGFLEHRGGPIAFGYVWCAKGVHFPAKFGYDAAYRQFGPGQLWVMYVLEHLHADPDSRLLDFVGPQLAWHEEWTTRSYPVGRIVVACNRMGGELLRLYSTWRPRVRRLTAPITATRALAAAGAMRIASLGKHATPE